MVRGYFATFSTYGFWLPNDERGSHSTNVRAMNIAHFGPATKTNTRQSVAHTPHNVQVRREAKAAMKYPEVILTGEQARVVARGFSKAIEESAYLVHACSILPQHVHLVIARTSDRKIEQIVGHLKARATQELLAEAMHPLAEYGKPNGQVPSPWTQRKGWVIYLNSNKAIADKVAYTQENPEREGKPRQHWSFVTPFRC